MLPPWAHAAPAAPPPGLRDRPATPPLPPRLPQPAPLLTIISPVPGGEGRGSEGPKITWPVAALSAVLQTHTPHVPTWAKAPGPQLGQRSLIPRGLWRACSMPHFRFHQGKRDKQGQRRMVAVRDRGPRAAQGKPTAGQGAAGRPVGPQVAQRQQNQKKRTVCLSHWPLPRAVQDTTPRAPGCPPPSTGSPSSGLRAWWLWV